MKRIYRKIDGSPFIETSKVRVRNEPLYLYLWNEKMDEKWYMMGLEKVFVHSLDYMREKCNWF